MNHQRILLLSLSLWCAGAGASGSLARADDDAWFAPDKGLHFGVSLGLAAGGYGVSSLWLSPPRYRALVGFSFALSLGLAKEAWDAAGHGDPSWRDVTWDVLGGLTGTALAWGVDLALKRSRQKCPHQGRRALLLYRF